MLILRMKKNYPVLIFLLFLAIVSVFYNYDEIIFLRPQSIHKWRQSDNASLALNYYQNGMHFFSPETHNLTSDGGTSGKCCPSEIPVFYYFIALLYKLFGYHDSIFRLLNTLIFLLGIFYLFRIFRYFLTDVFWSIALALLFFTSPVLVYYGNNFLSNSSSFAFSIIGWYYFFRFAEESENKWFYVSMLLFLIAAASKVTALFSVFAIAGMYFFEITGLTQFAKGQKLFQSKIRIPASMISIVAIVGSWILFASYYNQKHGCTYFSTTIFPVWDLTGDEIVGVLEGIRNLWLEQYFHASVLVFLSICFLFLLVKLKKSRKILTFSIFIILIEVAFYIILQFWTFADHDYYTIDMYILFVLLLLSVSEIFKNYYSKFFYSILVKVIFSVFLLLNMLHAHQKMHERYHGWMNDYDKHKDIYTITAYLRELGISENDTIVSVPDFSHASLYLMNQKGWTEYTDARFNKGEKIRYNQDSAGIQSSIRKGAEYLIINGIGEIYDKPYLESYCTHLKGHYGSVLVFDLKAHTRNFSLAQRIPETVHRCDAETLSRDSSYFLDPADSTLFEFGISQNSRFAHSGKHSSKLDADAPYGMTIRYKDLKNGESFRITVWRKNKQPANAGLTASVSAIQYFNGQCKVIEKDRYGWEKLLLEFFITPELVGQEITIYAYNPEPDPVYYDDLEIIRYRSVFHD